MRVNKYRPVWVKLSNGTQTGPRIGMQKGL
jgi:hypothetical protein